MNAADVVGYTYDGEFYCCRGHLPDNADKEQVSAVYASSEYDSYPSCGHCGDQCEDVTLTTEGEAWLKSQQEM